ncbi:CwfJ C-terminus 1-domain-containing protein-like protein [Halteromyces radiatus]|uniref:CwfJ C-terminus 1-domain-containing protein-like protein n=1 Tax=Halteromyces radiatus TaxID=101107 RepID=UPI00221F9368|nr:CwfJ C-terminus 1-domain-containing protein-like protein [Halteromyces radiatus]KAI8088900.1 CwfJ C-terminus 1-domain-containing protein-like protein [Halteromyces radiatus]
MTSPPGVDILLTTEWPKGIEDGTTKAPPCSLSTAASSIALLDLALKPRYHFADSENTFYEREPYENTTGFGGPDERVATHVSRFIGLGKALNKNKQRWFYAYNIVPMAKASPDILNAKPSLTTDCPFWHLVNQSSSSSGRKRAATDDNSGFFWGEKQQTKKRTVPEGYICKKCNIPGHLISDCPQRNVVPSGYVCKICNEPGHFIKDCPKKEERPPRQQADLSSCWFCLANPKIEKHLITSIGSEIYATLAKGPVISPESSPIPGGGHILLIAITHCPSFGKVPNESRHDVISDLASYKNSLRKFYASYDHDMVLFEVSRETRSILNHAHIQVIPVPKNKSSMVEEVARQEAKAAGYELTDQAPVNGAYFDMELPNGNHIVHTIDSKKLFNLQFGRMVVAKAIGQPEREDWKACAQSEAEERQAAKEFKEAYKSFDHTL